ncbi:hypothetical protein LVY72_10700 [Arthrobacter sp. I2-34]|uniref:DUF2383 domain-containing protein n=1 Tax=Arthrobacter hankyongi TaxID=2904801 RepID=A0ABS9L6U3_9MICC|nr:hypothetical protein [Arthrobacter hankyongi]MCG2622384.1 hypothetical protein [Arthrobacter hankyongi]
MPALQLDDKALAAYLDSHLVGSAAGLRMFNAAKRTWKGTDAATVLAGIEREVAGERRELKQLMHSLGYHRSLFKAAAARAGAVVGKLNPVNPLRSGGGATGQLELELLQSALKGKECLWRTLLELAPAQPQLDSSRLTDLLELVRRQQETVADIMRRTAPARFTK